MDILQVLDIKKHYILNFSKKTRKIKTTYIKPQQKEVYISIADGI